MKKIFLIILVILLSNCSPVKELVAFDIINNKFDVNKIRYDGYYTVLERDKHLTSLCDVVFNHQAKVNINFFGLQNNEAKNCEFYKNIDKFKTNKLLPVGKFTITGDEIYAFAPYTLRIRGSLPRTYMTHFKGNIKNRDTIVNWHVIEPYPHKIGKSELENPINIIDITPKVLVFVQTDAVKCLDFK
jgi:hypothetical protein